MGNSFTGRGTMSLRKTTFVWNINCEKMENGNVESGESEIKKSKAQSHTQEFVFLILGGDFNFIFWPYY